MNDARLPAHLEVAALIRRAQADGGNAAILHRGDRDGGAILLLIAERGVAVGTFERALDPRGRYGWQHRPVEEIIRKQSVNQYLASRGAIDPDLWIVELDIPNGERFGAEITVLG